MKPLEALEDIILYLNASEPDGLYCKNIEIIKNALKAFEIIKEEIEIDIALRFPDNQPMLAIFYKGSRILEKPISKDKFDLLKEVLGK